MSSPTAASPPPPANRPFRLSRILRAEVAAAVEGRRHASLGMRHDLIDEYRLYVHPIVIGRGKPMLRSSEVKVPLSLIETRTFGNGVVLLRYGRRPFGSAGG